MSQHSQILKSSCYYQTLGIPRNASRQQIKQAYKDLALKYHPDKTELACNFLLLQKQNKFFRKWHRLLNIFRTTEEDNNMMSVKKLTNKSKGSRMKKVKKLISSSNKNKNNSKKSELPMGKNKRS